MQQQDYWPERLIQLFRRANPNGMEKEYYPAYNILLTRVFTFDEGFVVAPVTEPLESKMSIDFTVGYQYIVEENNKPIFFVEVKAAHLLTSKATRKNADRQMRERFEYLFDQCPIDVLYGVSAFGAHICVYYATKQEGVIHPIIIEDHANLIVDAAPIDRWDIDIFDVNGRNRLNEIFALIKDMCANLPEHQ
jgi:hypothetical protein